MDVKIKFDKDVEIVELATKEKESEYKVVNRTMVDSVRIVPIFNEKGLESYLKNEYNVWKRKGKVMGKVKFIDSCYRIIFMKKGKIMLMFDVKSMYGFMVRELEEKCDWIKKDIIRFMEKSEEEMWERIENGYKERKNVKIWENGDKGAVVVNFEEKEKISIGGWL